MHRRITSWMWIAVLGAVARGDPVEMRVSRVTVFSSGVAFFEAEGTVEGNGLAELRFRTEQINDVLKSLVVQDLDGGRVSLVSYPSRDPVERTLRSFGVDLSGKPTLAQLLDQLRGQPVGISGPRVLEGTILGVERRRTELAEGKVIETDVLNLVSDAGLVQLAVPDIQGIRLLSDPVRDELRRALATLAEGRDADRKGLSIAFEGAGRRRVRVAWLLEAPIWKTSYRLILGPEGPPRLVGWALVENTTEDDWQDVRLSVISGRPISFRMDLYSPIYVPRPLEKLELHAGLRAPELAAGLPATERGAPAANAVDQDAAKEISGQMMVLGAAPPAGRAEARAGMPPEEIARRSKLDAGVQALAVAGEAGELFEYAIATPVTLPRQRSAMLLIVSEPVEAGKVSIYNGAVHERHPLNGLELRNTTKQHLTRGPVTVFDSGVYAGDAKLPDLKPGEKRLIAYGLDLSIEVLREGRSHPDEVVSLRIARGTLWHRHKLVQEQVYTVRNKVAAPRTVILEHPRAADWTLVEPSEPWEKTETLYRFRVPVEGGKTLTQAVREERTLDQTVALGELGLDAIRVWIQTPAIAPAVRQALERLVALRSELDRAARDRGQRERQLAEVEKEQARIRENLRVLERTADAYQRQLARFDELETQIQGLRGELAAARQEEEQRRRAVEDYLLSLDVE